jgi:hypothetical protein
MGESLYRSLLFAAVGRYEEWVPTDGARGADGSEAWEARCRSA